MVWLSVGMALVVFAHEVARFMRWGLTTFEFVPFRKGVIEKADRSGPREMTKVGGVAMAASFVFFYQSARRAHEASDASGSLSMTVAAATICVVLIAVGSLAVMQVIRRKGDGGRPSGREAGGVERRWRRVAVVCFGGAVPVLFLVLSLSKA